MFHLKQPNFFFQPQAKLTDHARGNARVAPEKLKVLVILVTD